MGRGHAAADPAGRGRGQERVWLLWCERLEMEQQVGPGKVCVCVWV